MQILWEKNDLQWNNILFSSKLLFEKFTTNQKSLWKTLFLVKTWNCFQNISKVRFICSLCHKINAFGSKLTRQGWMFKITYSISNYVAKDNWKYILGKNLINPSSENNTYRSVQKFSNFSAILVINQLYVQLFWMSIW